eukprot:jgi/Phyca11/533902/estExt2_fgenesh1_pg.C_PHYCAscaffold_180082
MAQEDDLDALQDRNMDGLLIRTLLGKTADKGKGARIYQTLTRVGEGERHSKRHLAKALRESKESHTFLTYAEKVSIRGRKTRTLRIRNIHRKKAAHHVNSTAVSHNNLNTTSAASQAGPKPARDVDGSKRLAEYARAAHARAAKRIKMHHRHAVRALRVSQAAHARNAKATACQRNDNCPQESETTGGNPIA